MANFFWPLRDHVNLVLLYLCSPFNLTSESLAEPFYLPPTTLMVLILPFSLIASVRVMYFKLANDGIELLKHCSNNYIILLIFLLLCFFFYETLCYQLFMYVELKLCYSFVSVWYRLLWPVMKSQRQKVERIIGVEWVYRCNYWSWNHYKIVLSLVHNKNLDLVFTMAGELIIIIIIAWS